MKRLIDAMTQELGERKPTEQPSLAREKEHAGAPDAVTEHMSMVDEQHNIVWADQTAKDLFGSDLVGKKCYWAYHRRNEPCESCVVKKAFAEGKLRERETSVADESKEMIFCCTSSVARRDANGRPRLVARLFHDIADPRQAEERSRGHLAEQAHVARLATMGEMASAIVHEINQPLAAITTYADTCRQMLEGLPPPSEERLRTPLEKIQAQAVRAGEIVRRLRGYLRKAVPCRVTTDLNEIVREVTSLLESEARLDQVSVELKSNGAIPNVLADSIQLQQVVLNLVRNAIDSISEGDGDRREVMITTSAAGGGPVEVAVCDSGPGLPAGNPEQVFEAFFTTKPRGLGMGLAISRSIIEAHGGRLWVTPNSDRGCTFRFTVPVAENGKDDNDN